MIILIHGDDTYSSRSELQRLINTFKGKEIRRVDARNTDLTTLTQLVESPSMFGNDTVVVIEHILTKQTKKTKGFEERLSLLKRVASDVSIILWEDTEIPQKTVQSIGTFVQSKAFNVPILIFQFLDGLHPGNAKTSVSVYRKTLATHSPEVIFSMLVKRIRHLIMLADGTVPEELQPWQASRLTSQSRLYTIKKLLSMHEKLLDIEYSIKSSTSPFDLTRHIEQFLVHL